MTPRVDRDTALAGSGLENCSGGVLSWAGGDSADECEIDRADDLGAAGCAPASTGS